MLKIVRSVFCAMLLVFLASMPTFARVDIHEETLTSAKVITVGDKEYQWLDPGASNRDVTLGSGIAYAGKNYIFYNSGSSNNLVIKDASATTLVTLMPTEAALVISRDGTTWVAQQWTSPEYIDFPSEATEAEMAAGTETDLRSMSPALVRNAVERIPRTKYCSTAAAVVAAVADSNYDVIAPTADFTLTAPLTIPAGKTYAPVMGAVVTTSAVNTLTFADGSHLVDNGGQMFSATPGGVIFATSSMSYTNPLLWGLSTAGSDTANTLALQAAINAASHKINKVVIPPGTYEFTTIYTRYDAVNNPTFSQDFKRTSMTIQGAGCINQSMFSYYSFTSPIDLSGTVLKSTITTGNAVQIGTAVPHADRLPSGNLKIRDITFLGETTGRIVDVAYAQTFEMERVFIGLKEGIAGTGLHINNAWESTFYSVFVESKTAAEDVQAGASSVGIEFDAYDEGFVDYLTGGNYHFIACKASNFKIGWLLRGGDNINLTQCGDKHCGTGTRIDDGQTYNFNNHYSEYAKTYGFWIRAGQNITYSGRMDLTYADTAGFLIGESGGAGEVENVTIQNVRFRRVNMAGAAAFRRYNNSSKVLISNIQVQMYDDPLIETVASVPDRTVVRNVEYIAGNDPLWVYDPTKLVYDAGGTTDYSDTVDWGNDERKRTASYLYDFDVDGGAISEIAMGMLMPPGSTVTKAFYEVITPPTSAGAATINVGVDVNDEEGMIAATAYDNAAFAAGYHDCLTDGAAANFTTKTAAHRPVIFEIATAALTAGKIYFWWEYVVSE